MPGNVSSATVLFDRKPSSTSGDFDSSADDLEELDQFLDSVPNNNSNNILSPHALRHGSKNVDMRSWLKWKERGHDIDQS